MSKRLLSPVVLYEIVFRFYQFDLCQFAAFLLDRTGHNIPKFNGNILSRWQYTFEKRHIQIEVSMVEWLNNILLDDFTQIFQVHHKTCVWVGNAFDRHPNGEIVSVPICVGAFSENFLVFLFGPILIIEFVRGIEGFPTCNVNCFQLQCFVQI